MPDEPTPDSGLDPQQDPVASLGFTPSRSRGSSKPSVVWEPPDPQELQKEIPQYKVLEVLGRGGMGAVYKGWQVSLERYVAIKVLPPDIDDGDAQFAARFKQEAKTMAKFMHPGIVGVFDAGETTTGLLYIVMEFVEGTDVSQMVRTQGKLTADHALAITAHVCDALHYAHTRGVIHRDIKPANIMVNTEGQVKVADFGLAKANEAGAHGLTRTNMAMGTPDYIAPECLITGIIADHRADLYSVGVMLYNMLTGDIPRGRFKPASEKARTDPRFDAIINKAMENEREDRYQSAQEIRRDLDVILSAPLAQAESKPGPPPPQGAPARKPVARGPQSPPPGNADTPARDTIPPPPQRGARNAADERVRATKKSSSGMIAAILGTVAVIGIGAFLVFGKTPRNSAPPVAQAGQAFDLIALTDPLKDRLKGMAGPNNWSKNATSLTLSTDARSGKIFSPVSLNGLRDYEVEIEVAQTQEEMVTLDFPVSAQSQATLDFKIGTDVSLVKDEKGQRQRLSGWPANVKAPCRLAGRIKLDADGVNGTLSASVNGQPSGFWHGPITKLTKTPEMHEDFAGQLLPALFVFKHDRTYSSWTLRVFEGEATVLRGTAASGVAPDKAKALFDGRTLAGWVVGGDPKSFTVEDGCIKATGSKGNLIYTGTGAPVAWTDFDLSMKVKTENNGNSGVWVHCPPQATGESAVALEVQIYNKPGDPLLTGSLFKIAPVDKPLARDGQWFDLRVVVRGLTVTVYLDGSKVNEWTQPADWVPPSGVPRGRLGRGSIGLQGYGGRTWIKDVRITLP